MVETLAKWAEQVAEDLNRRSASIEIWNHFYIDLTHVFANSAEALRGSRVLLTNDGKLAQALSNDSDDKDSEGSARRRKRMTGAVFLPSTRPPSDPNTEIADSGKPADSDVDDELLTRIPKSLHRFVQLVNSKLNCSRRIDDSEVRRFFVDNQLVNQFQTEDIQRLLANLTAHPGPGKNPDKRRMAALQFAFELAGRGQRRADLTEMQFRIPCRGGQWVRATRAYFGTTWLGTRGRQLAELIETTSSFCEDHHKIGENTLADFAEWPARCKSARTFDPISAPNHRVSYWFLV